jgi:lysophospholipase L1-like esterase
MKKTTLFSGLALLSITFNTLATDNITYETSRNKIMDNDGKNKFKIVMFGASTIAFRGKLKVASMQLQQYMDAKGYNVEVINSGVPGNNTNLALARFRKDVLDHEPDVVFIMLGINDSAIDVKYGKKDPRVSKTKYIENISNMVDELIKRKIIPVLMTTQPLIMTENLEPLYNFPPYSEKGFNFLLSEYVQALRDISKEKSIDLIDVFKIFLDKYKTDDELRKALPDGMHPGEEGQTLISEAIKELLRNKFNLE